MARQRDGGGGGVREGAGGVGEMDESLRKIYLIYGIVVRVLCDSSLQSPEHFERSFVDGKF